MKRKRLAAACAAALASCGVILGAAVARTAAAAEDPSGRALVGRLHDAYYSLEKHGMLGFQCRAQPNWSIALNERQNAGIVAELNRMTYTVTLGADGEVKIARTYERPPHRAALNARFTDAEKTIEAFFDVWSTFVLASPFPASDGSFSVRAVPGGSELRYRQDGSNVVAAIADNLEVREVRVTEPASALTIVKPSFARRSEGLVLTGYDVSFQRPGGIETSARVRVEHQGVDGMLLPRLVTTARSYGNQQFPSEVEFSACSTTRRP